jgi:membrane protein YqaA with SNARE-associated domain
VARVIATLHDWAESGWGGPAVAVYGVAQGSVMPGSSDLMLVALGLSDPPKAFRLALWAALGSSLGGIGAYAIGMFGFDAVSQVLGVFGIHQAAIEGFRTSVGQQGAWYVFGSTMSPLPTKLVCMAAGAMGVPFGKFLLALSVGRTIRFLVVALVVRFAGERLMAWLSRRRERRKAPHV